MCIPKNTSHNFPRRLLRFRTLRCTSIRVNPMFWPFTWFRNTFCQKSTGNWPIKHKLFIIHPNPSGVTVLEQCRSDVGSRHSSVGTISVSDTGSVSDECRNVRPIRYWIPTSFRHRISTSFWYWIPASFAYWIPISVHYQRATLIWYRDFEYNKKKQ